VTPTIARELGLSEARGAAIISVAERSPAEKAGLQVRDVVLEADQQIVRDSRALGQIIQQKSPGELIHFRIWRKGQMVDVEARLVQRPQEAANAPVADDARRAHFVQCNKQICPLCEDPANPMAGASDACLDCIRANSQQIEQCITGAAQPVPAGVPEQPGGSQATTEAPPPPLTLNRVEVKPARVAAGERFTITVSYTAAAGGVPLFRYAIRSGEQKLFESRPQNLEAGSGEPMFISKTLTAANKPGAYTIRVSLTLDEVRIEREAELTVSWR
jgi:membrane-associated protease RseP (regulator of RpoE activity)